MKLVFHNPHVDIHFGETLLTFLTRSRSFKKEKYLISYILKNKKDYLFYVDGFDSSLPSYIARFFPKKLEIYLWALINKIPLRDLRVTFDIADIQKDDVFFSFSLRNLDQKDARLGYLRDAEFLKVFHLTHFTSHTSVIASNVEKLKVDFLVAENNLSKNSKFFQHYFPSFRKGTYVLPFVYQERFKKTKDFSDRENLCLATGTIIKITEFSSGSSVFNDFLSFYKTDVVHPLREAIFQNRKQLEGVIDSYIANFWETKRKSWSEKDGFFKKWKSRIHNALFATKREYMKFDIVQKYNDYKMFVVPEEINDLPGIGFVEGMACGAAYIGRDDPMYRDLGLIPGKHYITHNGSLEDLKKKIQYYQAHNDELGIIAKNGYNFIREKFSTENVASTFYKDLETLSRRYKENQYKREGLDFQSSFVR